MLITNIISCLGMIFSIYGNLALAKKKVSGFYSFLLGNLMWIIYSLLFVFNVPMILQYLIFTAINIYGIVQYNKDDST